MEKNLSPENAEDTRKNILASLIRLRLLFEKRVMVYRRPIYRAYANLCLAISWLGQAVEKPPVDMDVEVSDEAQAVATGPEERFCEYAVTVLYGNRAIYDFICKPGFAPIPQADYNAQTYLRAATQELQIDIEQLKALEAGQTTGN